MRQFIIMHLASSLRGVRKRHGNLSFLKVLEDLRLPRRLWYMAMTILSTLESFGETDMLLEPGPSMNQFQKDVVASFIGKYQDETPFLFLELARGLALLQWLERSAICFDPEVWRCTENPKPLETVYNRFSVISGNDLLLRVKFIQPMEEWARKNMEPISGNQTWHPESYQFGLECVRVTG